MKSTRRGGALLAALALAASAAAPAAAAAAPTAAPIGFALAPAAAGHGNLSLRARPGQTVRTAVRVTNTSRRPMTVRLRAADIDTGAAGGPNFQTAPRRAGRWLALGHDAVRLAPGRTRRVRVALTVPRDAREGSHYAGVVATEDAARRPAQRRVARGTSTFSVTSVVRIAVPMTIALPGRRTRALALVGLKLPVDASGAALSVALRNTGTVLIRRAAVDLRVRRDGRTLFRHQAGLSEIMPESPLVYRIPWKGAPMQGTYRVVGTIRPAGAETLHVDAPVTFTEHTARELERKAEEVVLPESSVPPLVWLALAAAVALLAGMAVMLLRTRRRVPA